MSVDFLNNARVVVVGASSGIGLAVAQTAVAAGARVSIGSRSADKLAKVAAELGNRVDSATVDVLDEASVQRFFDRIDAIDHLVVCPGDMAMGSFADVSMKAIHDCLGTKIVGQLLCVRHAMPKFDGNGSIVLMSGAAGWRALAGSSITAAANLGVAAMAKAIALEIAPVRINVVVPGLIDTPLWSFMPEDARAALFQQTSEALPVGRIGTTADVADTITYALGSTFTTGTVLHVDGGHLLL